MITNDIIKNFSYLVNDEDLNNIDMSDAIKKLLLYTKDYIPEMKNSYEHMYHQYCQPVEDEEFISEKEMQI